MADRIREAVERAIGPHLSSGTLGAELVERFISTLAKAGITDESCIPGLRLRHTEDGTWLEFTASNGQQAAINLTACADRRGGVVGSALRQWCRDRMVDDATG